MKKNSCIYCGNNPVPHSFYWFSESLNILLTNFRQVFLYNPLTSFLARVKFNLFLENCFFAIGRALFVIRCQSDVKLCKIRRAQVLWEEAGRRGIIMREFLLFGKPIDVYEAERSDKSEVGVSDGRINRSVGWSEKKIIFSGLPRPAGYINKWLDLMDDKSLFKKALMKNGLPVPYGKSCSSFSQAKRVFNDIESRMCSVPIYGRLGSPINRHATIIIKPRAGSRGRHSTTFIFTEADLKKAFKIAKQLCWWVMVEEQLAGPVFRATVINGHLAGVLRGDPPQVIGDGQHGIAKLIDVKNSLPHPGVKNIVTDAGMELFLSRQNLKFSSVIPSGQTVNLSEKIGVNYGGSSSEDFEICHSDNKELFLLAAKVLGDPIVGFDFIIPNIAISWRSQKCGFIEVNSLPFINLHHDPLLGTARNAAALVWDMMEM